MSKISSRSVARLTRLPVTEKIAGSNPVGCAMKYENQKLDWSKNELKSLLERLIAGNYNTTAETIFNHVAHTGVETDLNLELKNKPSLEEFLKEE